VALDLRCTETAQEGVVMAQQFVQLALERLRLEEIAYAHRAPRHLVLIGRADTPARGADGIGAARRLAQPVERAMQRQDQGRILRQQQVVRGDSHPLLAESLDFRQQGPGIDDHAIADDRELSRAHHAGG